MTAFVLIAALLVIVALAVLLWPLLRRRELPGLQEVPADLSVYRDQLAELERDLTADILNAEQHAQARVELERRLLEEVADTAPAPARARSTRMVAAAIALLVPLSAAGLYLVVGNPAAIDVPGRTADASSISPEQFEALTAKLAARLEKNPEDAQGWLMLGRAYATLERFEQAAQAYAEADRRRPDNPDVLVEYAEVLAFTRGRNLQGEPQRLIERALRINPAHQKGLAMAGAAAFERQDYQRAIEYWQRLQKEVPAESEFGRMLAAGVAQAQTLIKEGAPRAGAVPTAPGSGNSVSGVVKLAPALAERVAPKDTLFIFARAVQGPPMPLAVLRRQAGELPVSFVLDDKLAMSPELKLSSFKQVRVSARISRSGDPLPQSGDLQGVSGPLDLGATGVTIVIDAVVP